jgi:hypothetical protein
MKNLMTMLERERELLYEVLTHPSEHVIDELTELHDEILTEAITETIEGIISNEELKRH